MTRSYLIAERIALVAFVSVDVSAMLFGWWDDEQSAAWLSAWQVLGALSLWAKLICLPPERR